MCAIFGFIGHDNGTPRASTLNQIIRANIVRGPHAFGLAWIDSRGRLSCYKQIGRLTDHMGILAMARDARILVGHLRWATHGDPANNTNNHPHPCDGGWLVHNGIVHNHHQLVVDHDLWPVSDCDSEVLGLMAEQASGSRLQRLATAANHSDGNLALLGIWSRPGTLVAVRRGNPLYAWDTPEGIYLATMPPRSVHARQWRDNQAIAMTHVHGRIDRRTVRLPEPIIARQRVENLSLYCGG